MTSAADKGLTSQKSLEIKTKSIETTLLPLVTQISTLVNFKDKPRSSSFTNEKTLRAINRVGEAVYSAVERFVSVGASIGNENVGIKSDLADACREARLAGEAIKQITGGDQESIGKSSGINDRQNMVQAARGLLSAVTRVLLLADMIVVKQIISAKKKVSGTLNQLESASSLSDFVKLFAIYGTQMVDLAHLTGDRQNDLKDERRRSQLSASRTVLEKFTMLILTSSKTHLHHPDCIHARQSRDLVYSQIRHALDLVHSIIYDSGSTSIGNTSNYAILLSKNETNFVKSLRQFQCSIDMFNVSMTSITREQLEQFYRLILDNSQDFTDSVYITVEQREKILQYQEKLREQLEQLFENNSSDPSKSIETISSTIRQTTQQFRRELEQLTINRASEFVQMYDEGVLLNELKTYSMNVQYDQFIDSIERFREQSDIIIDLCKLLRHVSSCDQLQVSSEYHDLLFANLSQMIIASARSLSMHLNSRVGKENLEAFCRIWEKQIAEFFILLKEVQEVIEGHTEKTVYLSLPRPGKHASFKPTRLDPEEQSKIAKTGLEMKLIVSEMDSEAEKWDTANNEIAKRAKNMSSMAYSMYLFTRGEGTLRTTQDLFTQAYYFVEEGTRLSAIVHDFTKQLMDFSAQRDVLQQLEFIPTMCRQLKLKLKTPVSGKTSSFTKVETVICEIRDLMTSVTRLCTTVFSYQSKFNLFENRSNSSMNKPSVYSRPPIPNSRRGQLQRTASIDRDENLRSKFDRSLRSSSVQRAATYFPTLDYI